MSDGIIEQATSTELTGGTGFTYEDTVVAYYLAALLRADRAAPDGGIVRSVAVQQDGHGYPMDDVIVERERDGVISTLGLQAKRKIRISLSDRDFADILERAVATRAAASFDVAHDVYGFAVEDVAASRLRTFHRLIEWAKASPSGKHFAARFAPGGSAAVAERKMRDELRPALKVASAQDERHFYAQFVALELGGLTPGAPLRTEVVNRLQELLAGNEEGQDLLLFDRLCRIARDGAGKAQKWTRASLLTQLQGAVRLKVAPNYQHDINLLTEFSRAGMAEVSEEIVGFRVERPKLEREIRERLAQTRLVNLTGLPGCGKSAMLKRIASQDAAKGPILFLKSDRLEGKSWLAFATALNLRQTAIGDLLAEIGAAGTPVLFIDGVDRVRPDQRGVINDILRAIETEERLASWTVLATSRDQGVEPYRTWFPASFYRGTGIGDVPIIPFTDSEAEALANQMPNLRRLLFGAAGVREIARRPFFAAVLARTFSDGAISPQTEIDLIREWWDRAGHDAPADAVPLRQRALLDIAERGVRNLGRDIPARQLKDGTFDQIPSLKMDLVIRDHDNGASYSFTHDIFFEWVFYRHLIELGDAWTEVLLAAGEPPLLGRVVGLLAQNRLRVPGRWSHGYRELEKGTLRPQWRREWLTAPPFSPGFAQGQMEFQALLSENDFALLEKLLVWFQAQHTISSPVVLQNPLAAVEGIDRLRMADLLSWPSDFESWGRLLDWLLPLAAGLPPSLIPHMLEVFDVWQNVLADVSNDRSAKIIELANSWLIELEATEYSEKLTFEHGRWDSLGGEARTGLAKSLRMIVMRAARAYPAPAIALFERAVADERIRGAAYADLMAFTPTIVDVSTDAIAAVAKAEILEELPQDRADREEREYRERLERIARVRAIPERERTKAQQGTLDHFYPVGTSRRRDLDDVGIDWVGGHYHPPSALHEPFATLLAKKPKAGLALIRDIANHATKGWRQSQTIDAHRGTPIPVTLEFPWGKQEFWGDWNVYQWFMGQLAPEPLECAFNALSYWAFNQIEAGQPTAHVIRSVLEGSECYASLGLALVLALETYDTSEVTFPIVTCQRLWEHDMARVVHEPMRNVDLSGWGLAGLTKLSGAQAKAKTFLESRASRKRDVRELAMHFAISSDKGLRARFKAALAAFPVDLPHEVEEYRSNAKVTAALKEQAERWVGLGDINNYRKYVTEQDEHAITYAAPNALLPSQEERLKDATTYLQEQSVIAWAMKSLNENALDANIALDAAVIFARLRESPGVLDARVDVGRHTPQTTLSAVAAVVIRFGPTMGPDYDWAWNVMERVARMREPLDQFSGSRIPWHPANHLAVALAHDRRSPVPRISSARLLIELTAHPIEGVGQLAFGALLTDPDEHIRWVAGQLAIERSFYYRSQMNDKGDRDDSSGQQARDASLARALERLSAPTDTPMPEIAPAWIQATPVRDGRQHSEGGIEWGDPDPSFDAQRASKFLPLFPVEAWCGSATYQPLFVKMLRELCAWTAERLMPSWLTQRRRGSDRTAARLTEWNAVLGDVVARAAPFFTTQDVQRDFVEPFLVDNEEGLRVLAPFTNMTVIRHVIDAKTIPANTFELLESVVDRVIADRTFRPDGYRAGQVRGWDMPTLLRALLFVNFDSRAMGSTRFANGDWSEVARVMPVVTRLVRATGWSTFVMENLMTLCERAGTLYPLDAFTEQASAVLSAIANAKGSWAGTMLPARIAGTVQRLADANFPLRLDQAQALLRILDALIDLGDRRSAALEQTEAFKGIQV